jgi:hypothetical protein
VKKQHIFAETCLYEAVGSLPVMPWHFSLMFSEGEVKSPYFWQMWWECAFASFIFNLYSCFIFVLLSLLVLYLYYYHYWSYICTIIIIGLIFVLLSLLILYLYYYHYWSYICTIIIIGLIFVDFIFLFHFALKPVKIYEWHLNVHFLSLFNHPMAGPL